MIRLKKETQNQIFDHAKSEFPFECCGAIIADKNDEDQEFTRRCRNVQNDLHTENPDQYPRDARTAYVIDPKDLFEIDKICRTENRWIKAFYHSHPDHPAYFSEKDRSDAVMWDEPIYPNSAHIVISIYDREIKDMKAFIWNEDQSDFVEVEVCAE